MRTEAYIQVVGWFNQTAINLDPTDTGGELDPHGADLAGNPLGGLMYSTGLPSGDNSTYQQTGRLLGSAMYSSTSLSRRIVEQLCRLEPVLHQAVRPQLLDRP